jgi:hypothetical protein
MGISPYLKNVGNKSEIQPGGGTGGKVKIKTKCSLRSLEACSEKHQNPIFRLISSCYFKTDKKYMTRTKTMLIWSITQRKRFGKKTIRDVRPSRKRCYNEDPNSHLYASHTVQFDRALAERGCTTDPWGTHAPQREQCQGP